MKIKNWLNNIKGMAAIHGLSLAAIGEAAVLLAVFIFLRPHLLAIKAVPPPPTPEGPYSSNILLVKFKPAERVKIKEDVKSTGVGSVNKILSRHGVKNFNKVARAGKKSKTSAEIFGWYKISLDPNRPIAAKQEDGKTVYPDLESLKSDLLKDPSVQDVSKDYQIKSAVVPNDPYYSSSGSWGQGYGDLWGLTKINAATAWDTTTGSNTVVVGIVDTGIDRGHADISANMWTNPGEIAGNGLDDDGNGYIDDVYGWNWANSSNNIYDDNGHGTHVAGTIAAVGNNGSGVVGVSWSTKVMALKMLGSNGTGSLTNGAQALQYAADMGAKVSNNSWTCVCKSTIIDDAVKYEHDRNVTTVAAAGNNNGADALDSVPADSDGTITVGATDSNDAIASFSNIGPRIDVTAPGVDILSLKSAFASATCTGVAIVNTNYCHISGTSMATPHVTGLVSLMLAVNPSLKPEQIRQILRSTSQDLGTAGRDNTFGYGRIKADTSVAATASPTVLAPFITSPASRANVSGTINITGDADGSNFSSYKVEVGAGRNPGSWSTITTSSTPVTAATLTSFDTSTLQDGSYTFRLTATSTTSQTYETKVFDVVVDNFDTAIVSPMNVVSFNSAIPIIGTAATKNGLGFQNYTIDYGVGTTPATWSTTGISLTGGGNSIVSGSSLATWDTSGLTNNQVYTLRLTVYAGNGGSSSITYKIAPDNYLISGWPKYFPGSDCGSFCLGIGTAMADLNLDGQKELVVPAATNKIYAFNRDGTAFTGFPVTVTAGDYFSNPPVIADLDGDLKPEIIVTATIGATTGRRIYIIKSDGTLYPGWPSPTFNVGITGDDPGPSVADLDGDGQKELIYYDYNVAIANRTALHATHLNGSDISGFPVQIFGASQPWAWSPPTVSDIDKDGHPEIICPLYQSIYVYSYQGALKTGWPKVAPAIAAQVYTFSSSPAIGDVDGDGNPDVVAYGHINGGGATDAVYAWGADGTLKTGWPYTTNSNGGSFGWPSIRATTVDIDGDGKDEVLTGLSGSSIIDDGTGRRSTSFFMGLGSLSVADFLGDGSLKVPGLYNPGIQWGNNDLSKYWSNDNFWVYGVESGSNVEFTISDMNHNGKLEFASSSTYNHEASIYLWEMPNAGSTNPKDSWTMAAHDPAHTSHYTAGQIASDTLAPQVVVTSPANNAAVSGSVSITANAIDETAVNRVEFYADGSLIGTDSSYPYSVSWNSSGASTGSHTLLAKAIDNSNNNASASVNVTVADTTAPSQPSNLRASSRSLNSITVAWDASTDNVAVTGYKVYRNGSLLTSTASTSYADSGLTPNTGYTYAVSAYDAVSNNSTQASASLSTLADTTAPSTPANIHVTSASMFTINLAWDVSTDDVGTTGYKVYRNGVLLGSVANAVYADSGLSPNTSYTYAVSAYDDAGNNSAQATTSLSTLPDSLVPAVSLIAPSPNINLKALQTVSANASDNIAISKVDFYVDDSLIASVVSAPYEINWSTLSLARGGHTLKVVATDTSGNTATDEITVTAPKKGDLNYDGKVGLVDLSIMLSRWGSTDSTSDVNGNGKVDLIDLSMLLSNYGK